MLKLKVCGMRDNNNLQDLLRITPDYIGFIFYKKSSRFVNEAIKVSKPKGVKYVGVFVDENIESILQKVKEYHLDFVQLHGNETPEFCKNILKEGIGVIKAFNISTSKDIQKIKSYDETCTYFLFDAKGKLPGGNGHSFNWETLKDYNGKTKFFLSGGISLRMAWKIKYLNHNKLFAIDINSQFEYSPALKNIHKINMFQDELQY